MLLLNDPSEGVQSQLVTRRGRTKHVVTLSGEAATKDLLLFCEYPFATLSDGRGKAGALQIANRIEHEWNVVDPQSGKTVRALWQVIGDEELGLPTAQDELVYLVLMQLSREQGFPELVRFTRHDLLKRLRWSDDAHRYEDIEMALRRLSGVRIYAENVMRPVPGKPGMTSFGTTGSSLIGDFYLEKEPPGRKKSASQKTEGESETARDVPLEPRKPVSHFTWSRPLQELLREGQIRSLDLNFVLSLHRPLSLRLVRYLGKKAYDGKDSFEIGLTLLCSLHLGMTPSPHESTLKHRLKAAHDELIGCNFLTRVTFSPLKTRAGQKVRYEFGPKAFEIEEDPALRPPPQAQPVLPFDGPSAPVSGAGWENPSPAPQTPVETPAKAQNEALSPQAEDSLAAQIEKIGVSGAVARELLDKFGAGEIELQLACLSDREPRDAAATFVKAVRENWAPPGAYTAKLEDLERETARRAAREEEERRKEAQAQIERQERERQGVENAQLDAMWERLDAPTRERLEREATEKLGILGRTGRAQAALVAMRRAVLRERLETLHNGENE